MAQLIHTLQSHDGLRSGARFLIVGALGTLVDLSLFALLHLALGVPSLAANSLSYSAGILNNYTFHRRWTFGNRPQLAAGAQFSKFLGVSLSALAANNLIVFVLAGPFGQLLGDPALGAACAKLCALGAGTAWNFLANHLWAFRGEEG